MAKKNNLIKKSSLSELLSDAINVNSSHCYQCGKCSAGCPLATDMDYTSSMIMRMLQVEDREIDRELLQSEAIWLCASCEMCISRCPMQIDIPKIMDYLRQRSLELGVQNKSASKDIIPFHRSFLDIIRWGGRSYEVGLVVDYKLRSKRIFQDLTVAPKMFMKGKLNLAPDAVKNKQEIKRIFKKTASSTPIKED